MSRKWEARQHEYDDSDEVHSEKAGRHPSNVVEVHMAQVDPMEERDNDGLSGPHQASVATAASLDGTDSNSAYASGSAHTARHR
jgi:hypothetical protein